ncbi:MAG: flagellar assembly peptidoglycan hydrolase FlgJ [Rhodocyclaceae bacterium]|nr:flagellar assembly peptidoglycan hydrolase FlgJ [Rhodocyclaceae bacterium]
MNAADAINAIDPRSFNELKRLGREGNSSEAIRAAARQFEALFLQMVLKAMRDATPKDGLLESDQSRLYQSLLDQQLAMQLANGGGTGFGDVIARQLGADPVARGSAASRPGGIIGFDQVAAMAARSAAKDAAATGIGGGELPVEEIFAEAGSPRASVPEHARAFVDQVWPHAMAASRATGIPAHFMVAQAALETGWGRHELKRPDGSPSYNLFNIKAGGDWRGATVSMDALEYSDGKPFREPSRFRAYANYGDAFEDYARLLSGNPRYSEVLGQDDAVAFARGLQQAGYATDPMYADKLARIIGGNTLRAALFGD